MTFTLYPAVDIRDGRTVRLERGQADASTDYGLDPVDAALAWVEQGATWLHVVDLDAAFTGVAQNRHLIRAIVAAVDVPVQASGGIRTPDDVAEVVDAGAQRVVVGTMALHDPAVVEQVIERFGERVAIGLDASGRTLRARGWTEDAGDLHEVLARLTDLGVQRVVYTDIARDGMLSGPNLDAITEVADRTTAAVTASGGVAELDDLRALARCHPGVDGAIVGKALYAGRFTLAEALAAVGGR